MTYSFVLLRHNLLQNSKSLSRIVGGATCPRLNCASVFVAFGSAYIHHKVGIPIALKTDGPSISNRISF
jgi:hypothetical protein